jgi:anaerobic magnesium-protoporphyrin IX monomethyl ester cyclase
MRFDSVLLIVPFSGTSVTSIAGSPLLSMGYISEALVKANIRHKIFDMTLGYGSGDLEQVLKASPPNLMGVTLWSYGYKKAYAFLEHLKHLCPSASIVVGGPHVSTLREAVLEECGAIDYGVVLEGEETLTELCRGTECSKIKGLVHRVANQVVYNGDRPFITNLDELGFPRYEHFELDSYPLKKLFITTSRGCPYRCIYCPVSSAIGKKFRMRSAESVIEEIGFWHQRGYRQLDIQDDNFTLIPERTAAICEGLLKKDLRGLILTCNNGVRADRVTKDLLALMFRSGFKEISFGVEVSNDALLKVIRKGETLAEIERAIGWACEIGFKIQLFFIVGAPTETYADFLKSTELALKYPVYDARFYNLIPFPHTELYDYLMQNHQLTRPYSEYLNSADHYGDEPYFSSPEFPLAERRKALEYGRKVSRTVMRRFVASALTRRYGRLMGNAAARLVCSPWFVNLSRNNSSVKKLVYSARTYLLHRHTA